jgi:hypothetical protein
MDLRSAAAAALLAALSAVPAAACRGAKELETPIALTIVFASGRAPVAKTLSYRGCRHNEPSDYLPAYSERVYRSGDGYALTILTDDGDKTSEVLLTKDRAPVGRFGFLANAALASGDPVPAGTVTLPGRRAAARGRATLRAAAPPPAVASADPD